MDKQSLAQAISNATNYAKNLKHQVSLGSPQPWLQGYSNEHIAFESYSDSQAFTKAKIKADSAMLIKGDSPARSRASNVSRQKNLMNMSMKMAAAKKDRPVQVERQSAFNKFQGRLQIKHLSTLLAGSLGTKEAQVKKNGHAHTYTYLNDLESDKFSQIDSNYSVKPTKINRLRHSKSPSKERHIEHNNTSYGEQSYKVNHHTSKLHLRERQFQDPRNVNVESKYLLEQIFQLEEVVKQYKMLILELKGKYLHVEEKLRQKILNDHYIDVLKEQIEQMQQKNHKLYVVIEQQRKTIDQGEKRFVQKLTLLNQHYSSNQQQNVQLKKQNQALRQILCIACQTPDSNTKNAQAPIKGIELGKDTKEDPYYQKVSKSSEQFWAKWT